MPITIVDKTMCEQLWLMLHSVDVADFNIAIGLLDKSLMIRQTSILKYCYVYSTLFRRKSRPGLFTITSNYIMAGFCFRQDLNRAGFCFNIKSFTIYHLTKAQANPHDISDFMLIWSLRAQTAKP